MTPKHLLFLGSTAAIGFAAIVHAADPVAAPAAAAAGEAAPAEALIAEADSWPLFRGTPGMTGATSAKLTTPLELDWTFSVEDEEPITSTAIIEKGRVYFGAGDEKFYCLDLETGEKKWEYKAGDIIEGTACFAGDLVVFGCGDGFVYALNKEDGKEKWKFETDSEILGSANAWKDPATGDHWILIGSYDNHLYCLNGNDGTKRWAYETGNYINGAAAVGGGKAMFGGCDGFIYQIDVNTGKPAGNIEMGHYISNTIAVGNGIAYVAHYGNRVAGYDLKDKSRVWEFGDREFPYFASPAIYKEYVVAAARDKHGVSSIEFEVLEVGETATFGLPRRTAARLLSAVASSG